MAYVAVEFSCVQRSGINIFIFSYAAIYSTQRLLCWMTWAGRYISETEILFCSFCCLLGFHVIHKSFYYKMLACNTHNYNYEKKAESQESNHN